ncbi:MAG: hypothetical protein ABI726_09725 [bacterium]
MAIDPAADWSEPVLLGALALIAAVAFAAEVRLESSIATYFDSSIALALVALAVAGPLPALFIWAVPDLLSRLVVRQDPILSPGMFATWSGYALALLAGDAVLAVAQPSSLVAAAPALFTAGWVMACVDFAVSGVLFAPFYQGYRVRPLVRSEFLDLAPAVMAILAVGVGVAALTPAWQVFALTPLALVILLPEFALAALGRSRSVARLKPAEASAVYASALADQLGLSRHERRLVDAATRPAGSARTPGPHRLGPPSADPPLTGLVVLAVNERWDGTGRPFAVPAACTMRASRVLAVARAWSSLTAAGTAQLSHPEAILDLAARAATQFDPEVVEAAAAVVAAEATFTGSADFEPRLHRWPLPAGLRRRGLPALAAHLAAHT